MPFRLNWKLTLFSVIFLCVFIKLGLWQIDRGYEKRELIAVDQQRRAAPGRLIADIKLAKQGMPVLLAGQFDTDISMLRDNVVLSGQVGYELIKPFVIKSHDAAKIDTRVLVNLGFVPMARTRTELPSLPQVSGDTMQIKGHIYLGQKNPMVTAAAEQKGQTYIVQSIDPEILSKLTGEQYYPHMIRLDEHEAIALPRHWPLVVMLPEKHFAYALTWFLMALAVLIAFISFTVKDMKEKSNND